VSLEVLAALFAGLAVGFPVLELLDAPGHGHRLLALLLPLGEATCLGLLHARGGPKLVTPLPTCQHCSHSCLLVVLTLFARYKAHRCVGEYSECVCMCVCVCVRERERECV